MLGEYASPLSGRYCSKRAKQLAGDDYRWTQIRRVWLAVLEGQIQLGLLDHPPSMDAVQKFRERIEIFDHVAIRAIESETRHDVMAHINFITRQLVSGLGEVIHVGMTSEDAVSNGEILQQRAWLGYILQRALQFVSFAKRQMQVYRDLPMLGSTHWQVATPVTLGKRIAMWIGPVVEDIERIEYLLDRQRLKGIRGATGTYEALLKLAKGDREKVWELQRLVAQKLGLLITELVPGQTAPRSWDTELVSCFASLASNLAKFAFDIRMLMHDGEVGEPRGAHQVGSSAMPWKQNPMKCERLDSLARLMPGHLTAAVMTQQVQGLERTLDDSAGRRIYMPESFLITDACLTLAIEVLDGLQVFEPVISTRLGKELPFIAMEEVLSLAVAAGMPRQQAHEELMELAKAVYEGLRSGAIDRNNLFDRLRADGSSFAGMELPDISDASRFVGMCSELCDEFDEGVLTPLLRRHATLLQTAETVRTNV